jgi:hypothetical protein
MPRRCGPGLPASWKGRADEAPDRTVIVWDGSDGPATHRIRAFGFGNPSLVQIVFVAGFLKVMLQFFLSIAPALAHGPHLLRCRSRVGVLVRAMIPQAVSTVLTHTEIVPPCGRVRKASLQARKTSVW